MSVAPECAAVETTLRGPPARVRVRLVALVALARTHVRVRKLGLHRVGRARVDGRGRGEKRKGDRELHHRDVWVTGLSHR